MGRILVAMALLASSAVPLHAAGAEHRTHHNPDTARHVTPTGVRVIVRSEPGTGLVAIAAMVDTTDADRNAAPGIKELVARSVFGAGANLSAEGIAREVYRSGGSVASLVLPDGIVLRCLTTPAAFGDAAYLIGQALKNAVFDVETVQRAASAADRDRLSESGQPLIVAASVARARLLSGDPYGNVQMVSERRPRSLPIADLARYYRTAFVPTGTAIAIVGDIAPEQARRIIENQMVDYDRAAPARREPGPPDEAPQRAGRRTERVRVQAKTAALVAACRAPSRRSSDAAATSVLAAIVGGGKASRLFKAIREARGIGYVVGAEAQLWRRAGLFMAFAEHSQKQGPEGAPDVVGLTIAVLDSIVLRPPDESELERAKRYVIGAFMRSIERTLDLAQTLAETELIEGDWRRVEDYAEDVGKVTVADVVRLAKEVLPYGVIVSVTGADSGSTPEPP